MRYKIGFPNTRRFDRAFHDCLCAGCDEEIEQGDPCGKFDDDRSGMYCQTCLREFGDTSYVETTKTSQAQASGTPKDREAPAI